MYSLRNKKKISQSSQILFLSQIDPVLVSQTSQTTISPPEIEIRRAERKRAIIPDYQNEQKISKTQFEKRSFNRSSAGRSNSNNSQKRSSSIISQSQHTNKKEKEETKERESNTYPELISRLENIEHTEESINKHFTARELQILLKPHCRNVPDLKRKSRCVSTLLQLICQHIIDCKQDDCIPSPVALPVIIVVMCIT